MSKAQKRNLEDEEISRRHLVEKEISRRKAIIRAIKKQKRAGKIDIKGTFELMYLNFVPLLEDRKLVEDDLNELKSMLNACADRMMAIMEKSRGKPQDSARD